jgi:phosphatidylserine/phosphatidylglycerophosphate/cardiolipin synthase-like enzyme
MGGWVSVGGPDVGVPNSNPPLFVGGPGRPDLGREVLRVVHDAAKTLVVVNHLVTEPTFIDALLAARRRRVQVRLVTELRENRRDGVRYPTLGFEHEASAELAAHFTAVRRLAGELVSCRGLRSYAHPKLLLADDRVLLVSSARSNFGWA